MQHKPDAITQAAWNTYLRIRGNETDKAEEIRYYATAWGGIEIIVIPSPKHSSFGHHTHIRTIIDAKGFWQTDWDYRTGEIPGATPIMVMPEDDFTEDQIEAAKEFAGI